MTTTLTDSDLRGLGFALGRYRETCPDPHAADNMAVRVLGSLGADERQNDTLDSYYLIGGTHPNIRDGQLLNTAFLFTPGGVVENGFARVWLFVTSRVARLNTDFAAERRQHPLRDAWWEAITPDLSKITVPILECTSFSDSNLHSVGSMRAFQRLPQA